MILLDTDHLTMLVDARNDGQDRLRARLRATGDRTVVATVVSVEEHFGGWLAFINRQPDVHQQIPGYQRLQELVRFYYPWRIVPFDNLAADYYKRLRKQKVRIGARDLKIASMALVNDALLLSANLRDFRQVPGLRVEDWLGPQREPPASADGGQAAPTS